MFSVGGSGPAHSAPPGNPSAQPFSPRPRSTAGAHIDPCGPTGGLQAVHQYQSEGDAHEATQAGRAWAGGCPRLGLELRVPGLHPTAQTPRTPEQKSKRINALTYGRPSALRAAAGSAATGPAAPGPSRP